jgi:hypothetical protein
LREAHREFVPPFAGYHLYYPIPTNSFGETEIHRPSKVSKNEAKEHDDTAKSSVGKLDATVARGTAS